VAVVVVRILGAKLLLGILVDRGSVPLVTSALNQVGLFGTGRGVGCSINSSDGTIADFEVKVYILKKNC
jgi:hypothetical protein